MRVEQSSASPHGRAPHIGDWALPIDVSVSWPGAQMKSLVQITLGEGPGTARAYNIFIQQCNMDLKDVFFSNSLKIQNWKPDILTIFFWFYFFVFFLVLVSIEMIHQTPKTVFHHISKRLDIRQNYSATRRISNSPFSVWKCGQKWSTVFDKLLKYSG